MRFGPTVCMIALIMLMCAASIGEATVSNIEVSNMTSQSFVVTWMSSGFERGTIRYGTSPTSVTIPVNDVRERDQVPGFYPDSTQTHYIVPIELQPNAQYYFYVTSGGTDYYSDSGALFELATAPLSENVPVGDMVFGDVLDSNFYPVYDAIILFHFERNGMESTEMSTYLSGLSDHPSTYQLFTGAFAYYKDTSSFYTLIPDQDRIVMRAFGGDRGATGIEANVIDHYEVGHIGYINIDLSLGSHENDLDGDGAIGRGDVELIIGHIMNISSLTAQQQDRADLDNNGTINIADLIGYVNMM
ncbi:MAG: hypothetical protein B6244_06825 [Candidatus Cloacimonetes bacterium 4572_55]|nr:MAG: hypothetical protein B6244_06825 [Candidatus Cloacimonetes bacterium 4572_55]